MLLTAGLDTNYGMPSPLTRDLAHSPPLTEVFLFFRFIVTSLLVKIKQETFTSFSKAWRLKRINSSAWLQGAMMGSLSNRDYSCIGDEVVLRRAPPTVATPAKRSTNAFDLLPASII